uniref:Uncharacterized protein n=1 Tax=Tanacetum cinerariifolium TaxID=118510 RepID=A0A6L2L3I9_TANCI|nr:hypothetical protein [Tanacetum cinerariifolium]
MKMAKDMLQQGPLEGLSKWLRLIWVKWRRRRGVIQWLKEVESICDGAGNNGRKISFFYLHFESASGHDVLADSTAEADPRPSALNDSLPSQQDKTKSAKDGLITIHTESGASKDLGADEISKKIKLEDLANLLKDTRSAFFTPDSSPDEPINVSDKSDQEEVKKAKETLATSQDKELEQLKAAVEAKVTSLKANPSYPDINQLTTLLVTSLKPKLAKLFASHYLAICLPSELKELPSKVTKLSEEIKDLKQHLKDMELELPEDLKEILSKLKTFTYTIFSLSSQVAELKNIQWELPAEILDLPHLISSF